MENSEAKCSKIELRNKNGDISYCLVSPEHFEQLNQHKWHKSKNYITAHINKKTIPIHRFIFTNILNEDINGKFIDHMDNNPLNNTLKNLRIVTCSENTRNREKTKNAASKYYGVFKSGEETGKIWKTMVIINNKSTSSLYFESELHAAYQYDLLCKENNLTTAKLNNIEKPIDFVPYKKKEKGKIAFSKQSNKYTVQIISNGKKHYFGSYENIEDALRIRNIKKEEILNNEKEEKERKLKETEIKRNEKGECIIEHFNRKKERVGESIVDEEIYYELMKYKWSLTNKVYSHARVNGKNVLLSRHIMNCCDSKYFVDHINGNTFDNQRSNLRIVTPQQNNLNKKSAKNSSSKFTGVQWNKQSGKWMATITLNGKAKYLGSFDNELDAAAKRKTECDKVILELSNQNPQL